MAEQPVVAHPEQPDDQEADGETEDSVLVGMKLVTGVEHFVGHPEVHHQQGDGDGEDRVAEEQHPVVLQVPRHGERVQRPAATLRGAVRPDRGIDRTGW